MEGDETEEVGNALSGPLDSAREKEYFILSFQESSR